MSKSTYHLTNCLYTSHLGNNLQYFHIYCTFTADMIIIFQVYGSGAYQVQSNTTYYIGILGVVNNKSPLSYWRVATVA